MVPFLTISYKKSRFLKKIITLYAAFGVQISCEMDDASENLMCKESNPDSQQNVGNLFQNVQNHVFFEEMHVLQQLLYI